MKKIKGHKCSPSNPSNPSHPSHPSHQTRPSASWCRCSHWTPEGHCGCLVTQIYRPIRTIKTPTKTQNLCPHPPNPIPNLRLNSYKNKKKIHTYNNGRMHRKSKRKKVRIFLTFRKKTPSTYW